MWESTRPRDVVTAAPAPTATLGRPITAEELQAVKSAATQGWTISKITTGRPIGGGPANYSRAIVNGSVLFARCKRDPEFARILSKLQQAISAVVRTSDGAGSALQPHAKRTTTTTKFGP
jgi:hypothetical protein